MGVLLEVIKEVQSSSTTLLIDKVKISLNKVSEYDEYIIRTTKVLTSEL